MCHIREYRTTLVGRESCGKVERNGWERVAPTILAVIGDDGGDALL